MKRRALLACLAVAFAVPIYGEDVIVDGMKWPSRESWPQPKESRFIAASGLALSVYRDELNHAPAAKLQCPLDSRLCRYTFDRCEEVWIKRIDDRRGYISIEANGLAESKAIGGEWWLLLATTKAACEDAVREPANAGLSFVRWTPPFLSSISGIKVWGACRAPAAE